MLAAGSLSLSAAFFVMYLLYLDDSGSVSNASDRHVILAGIAVFERQPHWLSQRLDEIAARLWPDNPASLEFRGSAIHSGRDHWRGIPKAVRLEAYREALSAAVENRKTVLFGAAIDKAAVSPADAMEFAFEQICNRFDLFLGRLHKAQDTQRGLLILDQSSYETSLQGLARTFRTAGHRWGTLHNFADVPFFVNSKATRMVQYADLIAYALRRQYEHADPTYLDMIVHRFDGRGGVLHGLVHYASTEGGCQCASCQQRRSLTSA